MFNLSVSTSLYPQQAEVILEDAQQLSANHYASHLITGLAAQLGYVTTGIIGLVMGDMVARTGTADWISYQMGLTTKEFKYTNFNILFAVRAVPLTLSMLAGLYVMYKTPQWTDKYLLKKKKERTSRQNVLVFCNRALLGWPIGILTGEYFTH